MIKTERDEAVILADMIGTFVARLDMYSDECASHLLNMVAQYGYDDDVMILISKLIMRVRAEKSPDGRTDEGSSHD